MCTKQLAKRASISLSYCFSILLFFLLLLLLLVECLLLKMKKKKKKKLSFGEKQNIRSWLVGLLVGWYANAAAAWPTRIIKQNKKKTSG